jgi:hypothetical protein
VFPPVDPTITDVEPHEPATDLQFTEEDVQALTHEQLCAITVSMMQSLKQITSQLIAQGKMIEFLRSKIENV